MEFPDQAAILRNEPDAMLERGRRTPAVGVTRSRTCRAPWSRDLEFGGQQLTAEDQIIVVYPAAEP